MTSGGYMLSELIVLACYTALATCLQSQVINIHAETQLRANRASRTFSMFVCLLASSCFFIECVFIMDERFSHYITDVALKTVCKQF